MMNTPIVYLPPNLELKINRTDQQLWQLCQDHDNLKFEHISTGERIIILSTGGNTSKKANLVCPIKACNHQT